MKTYLTIENTPPRTSAGKRLQIRDNAPEGNMVVNLYGGWSEYKPEEVEKIILSMQEWLQELRRWVCKSCHGINRTTPHTGYDYKFARCRHCKKKTPLDKLELDNNI